MGQDTQGRGCLALGDFAPGTRPPPPMKGHCAHGSRAPALSCWGWADPQANSPCIPRSGEAEAPDGQVPGSTSAQCWVSPGAPVDTPRWR